MGLQPQRREPLTRRVFTVLVALAAAGLALALTVMITFVIGDRIARARASAEQPDRMVQTWYVDVPFWPSLLIAGAVFGGVLWWRLRTTGEAAGHTRH